MSIKKLLLLFLYPPLIAIILSKHTVVYSTSKTLLTTASIYTLKLCTPSSQTIDKKKEKTLQHILHFYQKKNHLPHLPIELKKLIFQYTTKKGWALDGYNLYTGTVYDFNEFDIQGIHRKTTRPLDLRGFRQNGTYKDVDPTTGAPTYYNPEGYDINRWNKKGKHEFTDTDSDLKGFIQSTSYASIGLYMASIHGNTQAVKLLLKRNPTININLQDKIGETALHYACKYGYLKIVILLLKHPAIHINLQNMYDQTGLHYASNKCYPMIMAQLLKYPKINVNLRGYYNNTPLHNAYYHKSEDSIHLLLAHSNIDINLQNSFKKSCLHLACEQDSPYRLALLLNQSTIKVNLLNEDNKTPLDIIWERQKNYQDTLPSFLITMWNHLVQKGATLHCYKN